MASVRVLFSTGALYGLPLTLSLRLAARAGCDGVEMVLDPLTILAGPQRAKRLAEREGVDIAALHPSLFGLPGWTKQPLAFRRLGRYALGLDCPLIVVHPPRFENLASRMAEFERGIEALKETTADRVQVTVENVAVFGKAGRQHPYTQPANVAELAEAHGLGLTFDTTHAVSADLPVIAAYESVAHLVRHVHLSDFRLPHPLLDRPSWDTYFKHHRLPGDGEADLRSFLRRLRRRGYRGAVTLELSPVAIHAWHPRKATELVRRSVDYVREAWESASERVVAPSAVLGV